MSFGTQNVLSWFTMSLAGNRPSGRSKSFSGGCWVGLQDFPTLQMKRATLAICSREILDISPNLTNGSSCSFGLDDKPSNNLFRSSPHNEESTACPLMVKPPMFVGIEEIAAGLLTWSAWLPWIHFLSWHTSSLFPFRPGPSPFTPNSRLTQMPWLPSSLFSAIWPKPHSVDEY